MEHILINKNVLKEKLEKFELSDILNLNEKRTILNKWITEIEDKGIETIKEEALQGLFLGEIFGTVLNYISRIGNTEWNLEYEQKTKVDSKKADGALGFFESEVGGGDIHAVIELKDGKTNLDLKQNRKDDKRTPIEQAFDYAAKSGKNCKWVIVSNFKEIRLYNYVNTRMEEYHLFDIAELKNDDKFKEFYYLLNFENLISKTGDSKTEKLCSETVLHQEAITKKFYTEYKIIRLKLFETLKANNPEKDEIFLLEKTQKLLDRFLFVFFARGKGILPSDIIDRVEKTAKTEFSMPRWQLYKFLFDNIDSGHENNGIFAYNGGLFKKDAELDSLNVSDDIFKEIVKLSTHDYEGDLNVNILGHIFEQSISDLEEIKASVSGEEFDKTKGKRKKDGVYYTPEYITRYIVEQAIGGWLEDRKKEIENKINEEIAKKIENKNTKDGKSKTWKPKEYFTDVSTEQLQKDRLKDGIHLGTNTQSNYSLKAWQEYKEILKNIKILDPACGSGAFLIQALNYLVKEGNQVNKIISYLQGGTTALFNLKADILRNNLYGVDLNAESVEITKLSLWLNSVEKGEKLTALDNNIKCGNSLIDDMNVAGDKAFKWEEEFKEIIENGGFDVVIGNPPYGAKLSTVEQNYLINKYIQGGGETVISFLKFSYGTIKNGGYLGFIIPKSFIFSSNYQSIRSYLKEDIFEIVDCKKVWDEVKLEQCIVELKKNSETRSYHTSVLNKPIINKIGVIDKSTFEKYGFFLNNVSNQELNIADRMNSFDHFLNDISRNSRGGLFQKYISETGDYRVLGGAEIQRHGIVGIKGTVGKKYVENDEKSIIYENSVLVQRIVAHITKPMDHIKITACIPKGCDYRIVDTINQIVVKPEVSNKLIWLLLNSKLINWYAYRFIFAKAIRTMQFDNPVTSRIPIPKISPEKQAPFIEKADLMLNLNKEFQKKKKDFFKILKVSLNLNEISKKLDSFNEIEFNDFVKELKKQKITIPKKDIPEYSEIFEEYRKELNNLQDKINKTDSEIDKMVFDLYELTEEERKLVLNS
ncbi:N-6 DNA methylase [Methanococcus vannielii SB]|uniref:site-specific DNA-methyltransferase (adenine-specific) n=1 Tax=Methanococcus vannielii (strain ATCC 35089 / DSM 1224 / JCM 13029 / OCM 148 / SB) TaxID=406327 RepID=A6URT5_METVS|nr:N-6 DNA methylase [Methanococcus vannielii]ABR55207.1 N-6 DNA methylase [Methanococcus vannielii SB]